MLQQENINLEDANIQLLHEVVLNRDAHRSDIGKLQVIVDGLVQRLDRNVQQEKEVERIAEPQQAGSSGVKRGNNDVSGVNEGLENERRDDEPA